MVQNLANNFFLNKTRETAKSSEAQNVQDEAKVANQSELTKGDLEAVNAESNDEATVSYEIKDDASEVNEAQQEVENAEKYGATLKDILTTLMNTCDVKNLEMADFEKDLNSFMPTIEADTAEVADIAEDVQEAVKDAESKVKEAVAEAEEKAAQIEENNDKIEELSASEEVTEAEAAEIQDLEAENTQLNGEIKAAKADAKSIAEKAEVTVDEGETEIAEVNDELQGIQEHVEVALNSAVNANEYADVTIEKGKEASDIKKMKDARKAGFKTNIFGIGQKKKAVAYGNMAIAKGEQLGGSTVNVSKLGQDVASQNGIAFSENSKFSELASKEYVDTSKLADIKDVSSEKGLIKKLKAAKNNRNIYADIAAASKNKGQSTTEA